VHGVASWNGTEWSRLGFGLFDDVRQLVVHEGQLIAAGGIDWNGYDRLPGLARWDGASWVRLDANGPGPGGIVSSVVSLEEGLLALAGRNDLRIWDGYSWREWERTPANCEIRSLGVDRGKVFIYVSYFEDRLRTHDDLLMWNEGGWQSITSEIDGRVLDYEEYDESLYVGGVFTQVGSNAAHAIARWHGPLGPVIEPASINIESIDEGLGIGEPHAMGTRLLPAFESARGGVRVRYDIASDHTPVRVLIYDVRGRLVRTLVDGIQNQGHHSLQWDRRDAQGRRVPRGTYFLQLRTTAGSILNTKKLVLIK
jgi:hypothetical protein